MVTTRAGSSASPQGRAASPPAPPDGTDAATEPQDKAVSPPGMDRVISATIPTKSDIFVHVLTNVLRQPSDGPLARALDEAGINEINDLLTLDHQSRNALMYEQDDGTVRPLPLGYMNLIRVLKIFTDYCQDSGMPIDDWMAITKRDFDEFRRSCDGLALTEKSDAFVISAPTPIISPTPSALLPNKETSFPSLRKESSEMPPCSSY